MTFISKNIVYCILKYILHSTFFRPYPLSIFLQWSIIRCVLSRALEYVYGHRTDSDYCTNWDIEGDGVYCNFVSDTSRTTSQHTLCTELHQIAIPTLSSLIRLLSPDEKVKKDKECENIPLWQWIQMTEDEISPVPVSTVTDHNIKISSYDSD